MSYSMPPDQVIKAALIHAIDDRRGMIDAYRIYWDEDAPKNAPRKRLPKEDEEGYDVVQDALREVIDFRKMLRLRYRVSYRVSW